MLDLQDLVSQYPPQLQGFQKNILREYLQCKVLEIIAQSPINSKLSFIGGTALRIIHNNNRFSEDLDFDNFNLTDEDFESLTDTIQKKLALEGYQTEVRLVHKGAYRCYLKFPNLLYQLNLSPDEEAKILIQVDTASHNFTYQPSTPILNKFNIFTPIRTTPIDILLSQKIHAAVSRKTPKGRDFYDIVFLLSKTKPNYDYLKVKMSIQNSTQLKTDFLTAIVSFNFTELAKDVEPFLFNPQDSKRVLLFKEYFESANLT